MLENMALHLFTVKNVACEAAGLRFTLDRTCADVTWPRTLLVALVYVFTVLASFARLALRRNRLEP